MKNLALAIIYECMYSQYNKGKGMPVTRRWAMECVPFLMNAEYYRTGRLPLPKATAR